MRLSVICVALLLLVACWAQPFLGEGALRRFRPSRPTFGSQTTGSRPITTTQTTGSRPSITSQIIEKLFQYLNSESFRNFIRRLMNFVMDVVGNIIKSIFRRSGNFVEFLH
ncbi:uncharacterized protein [Periplaneta americana]|uniref:uncharacterized protein isoform X1 n=1 Tax=Periplaneta americana TaxID=6978 RepID=UPI0037E7C972